MPTVTHSIDPRVTVTMSTRLVALISRAIVDLKYIREHFSERNEDDHHSSGAMMISRISSSWDWREILLEIECLEQKLQHFLEGLHGLDRSVAVKLEQLSREDGDSEIHIFEPDMLKLEPKDTDEVAPDSLLHGFDRVCRETNSLQTFNNVTSLEDGDNGISYLHVAASSRKGKEKSRRGKREAGKESEGGVLPDLRVTVEDTPRNGRGGSGRGRDGSRRGRGRSGSRDGNGSGGVYNASSEPIAEEAPKRKRKEAGKEKERRKLKTLKLGLGSSNVANEDKNSKCGNTGTDLKIYGSQCASAPAVVAPGVGGSTAEDLESNEDLLESAGDQEDRKDHGAITNLNFAASLDGGSNREPTTFVCDVCEAEFHGRDYWLRHIKEHGKQGSKFECDICHKEFKGLESMKNHKRLLHKSDRFPCEFCDEKFSQKTRLKTHLRLSHRDDPNCRLICHLCGQRFAEKSQHEEHMNTHLTKSRNFECDICQKRFTCSGNMKSHKKKMHNPARKKTVQCSYCAMMFYHESVCLTHQAFVHEKRKDFQCSFCPRKFPSLQSALIHERSHTGQKPYACQYQGCGKHFGDRTNLRNHQVTHTGVKPYKCDSCDAGFMRKKQLQDHKQNRCPARS